MGKSQNVFVVFFVFVTCAFGHELEQAQQPQFGIGMGIHFSVRLPQLNVNPRLITLSGFSSGGTFAQQLYVSHSSLIKGIAVFSHTYYRCGPNTGIQADYDLVCTKLGNLSDSQLYNPNNAIADIQNYFSQGLIDNPRNILNKPLYVYAGTSNSLFSSDMSLRILQVFEPFIQNPNAIRTRVQNANLVMPTINFGGPCAADADNNFFLANCGISGAFESLQFLLGPKAVKLPSESVALQPLFTFDQTEFFYGINGRHDMDQVGFLYVPATCQTNAFRCPLHFYFHGCLVGREFVGSNHIINSGFLQVAEENNIIMVFPQAIRSRENDIGCWDTYGFTSNLYATKLGSQVTVVRNMLSRLLGEVEKQPGTSENNRDRDQILIIPSLVEYRPSEIMSVQNVPATASFHESIPESKEQQNPLGPTTIDITPPEVIKLAPPEPIEISPSKDISPSSTSGTQIEVINSIINSYNINDEINSSKK